jgi:hypothetical protein
VGREWVEYIHYVDRLEDGSTVVVLSVGGRRVAFVAGHLQPAALGAHEQAADRLVQSVGAYKSWALGLDANCDMRCSGMGPDPMEAHPDVPDPSLIAKGTSLATALHAVDAAPPQLLQYVLEPTHFAWGSGAPGLKDYVFTSRDLADMVEEIIVLPVGPKVSDHVFALAVFAFRARPRGAPRRARRPDLHAADWDVYSAQLPQRDLFNHDPVVHPANLVYALVCILQ